MAKPSKQISMNPVQIYKCLADETRLRSLLLIEQEQELCVCELEVALEEIQPKVSRHLAHLRKNQLLIDRRQGKWVFYRINPDLPDWVKSILSSTLAANKAWLGQSLKRLSRMGDRPERSQICCS